MREVKIETFESFELFELFKLFELFEYSLPVWIETGFF